MCVLSMGERLPQRLQIHEREREREGDHYRSERDRYYRERSRSPRTRERKSAEKWNS